MMKRIAIWLLIVVYLPQTMGIRMAIHFCAGDFDRIVFFDDSDSYCDCGAGMSKIGKPHKSCCKDVHVRCEIKSKQVPSAQLHWEAFEFMDCIIPCHVIGSPFEFVQFYCPSGFRVHDPPPVLVSKVFLRNQVFRL